MYLTACACGSFVAKLRVSTLKAQSDLECLRTNNEATKLLNYSSITIQWTPTPGTVYIRT